ncbi:FMN-red domain-containing protein [Fusarium sp. LHS14.1]|nr:FMN-red domain-containing protein [Fusarium sp. LHS14.1]
MAPVKKIALITTSTRKSRVGPKVADLVHEIINNDIDASSGVEIIPVDVADFKLPIYDEEVIPAMVPAKASFSKPHTIAWSTEIGKYDAYVLVIPEYNFGIAGATKNAIDYLYNEWIGKPVMIVSYGIQGGTFASEQLNKSLTGMKLRVAETRPSLKFHGSHGPDLFLAMGSGGLGEDTRKDIEAEAPTILKAFQELKELLKAEKAQESA